MSAVVSFVSSVLRVRLLSSNFISELFYRQQIEETEQLLCCFDSTILRETIGLNEQDSVNTDRTQPCL